MHLAFLEGFPGTVAHLTMVENTVFYQHLPHAHSLRSGVNTWSLLQHPVHQLGSHTALSTEGQDTEDGGHPHADEGWEMVFERPSQRDECSSVVRDLTANDVPWCGLRFSNFHTNQ